MLSHLFYPSLCVYVFPLNHLRIRLFLSPRARPSPGSNDILLYNYSTIFKIKKSILTIINIQYYWNQYYYLIYRPYSGFVSCLDGILRSKGNPRSHVANGCHVFLVSFKLEPSFRLSLTFRTLTFLESTGQSFCRTPLALSHTTPDVLIPPQLFSCYTGLLSVPLTCFFLPLGPREPKMSHTQARWRRRDEVYDRCAWGTNKLAVLPTAQMLMDCKSQGMWGRWGRRPGSP